MTPKKLLKRLAHGAMTNVRFTDLLRLTPVLGFHLSRVAGSHHILVHPRVSEIVNPQEVRGEAKPYQVRQLMRLVERHSLRLENDE